MHRIVFDPQIFNLQKFGGISRYYTELLDKLNEDNSVSINLPMVYTDNLHYQRSSLYKKSFQYKQQFLIKYSKIFRNYRPKKLKKRNTLHTIEFLKKQEYDLFVPSYYDPYFLEHIGNKPFVLTVHDMINELLPHYFTNDKTTVPNKKLLMDHAAKIIAVSDNTRKDIIRIYPDIDPQKIEVIHLSQNMETGAKPTIELPENYILFVGNRGLYKNFIFLLKAVEHLLKESPGLKLLCAGGGSFSPYELKMINTLGLDGKVIQHNFEDTELSYYYNQAKCFVFPTQYEGFGIPVLEAMASGCPVVLGKHSSLAEVAGEAGIYYNQHCPLALESRIKHLVENEEIRKESILKGWKRVKLFSWEKNAKKTLDVYKSILE